MARRKLGLQLQALACFGPLVAGAALALGGAELARLLAVLSFMAFGAGLTLCARGVNLPLCTSLAAVCGALVRWHAPAGLLVTLVVGAFFTRGYVGVLRQCGADARELYGALALWLVGALSLVVLPLVGFLLAALAYARLAQILLRLATDQQLRSTPE